MRSSMFLAACAVLCTCRGQASPATADPADPPFPWKLRRTILLPGVEGRIDHLALDAGHDRLFVAALGNGSLECVDLGKGTRTAEVPGFKEPQGVVAVGTRGQVVVACGGDGAVEVCDAATLKETQRLDLGDDADNLRLLPDGKVLLAGCKGGALATLEADADGRWRKTAETALARHPEGFEAEPGSGRVFVNIPPLLGDGQIAVVDRKAGKVTDTWRIEGAGRNFPMALDADGHRLYAGCRNPARVAVLDTATGKTLATVPCVADADDLFVDASARRLFIIGGGGRVDVFALGADGVPAHGAQVPTARGARTGLWDAAGHRLLVAVPRQGGQEAQIRVYAAPK